jgi:probable H4MPT-linked C1 transfer pathway protein
MTKVSSEMFAQSGDVHLLLDNIEEKNYTVETCDGRGKTRKEAAARLARVICADMDMMTEREILKMAKFVYEEQVDQIACSLRQVNERINPSLQEKRIIVSGLGRNFLARKAAEKVGFKDIIDIKEMIGKDAAILSPSFGVALMAATMWEGKNIEWKLF